VAPLAVIISFDVSEQVAASRLPADVVGVVNQLGLQGVEPAFHRGVVPAIALSAQGRHEAIRFQQRAVITGGVLAAAIGVVNEPGSWALPLDRHGQCGDRQLLAHVMAHRPSHHLTAEEIQDDGELQPPLVGRDVTDVGEPDLVRPRGEKGLPEKIVSNRQGMIAIGGDHTEPPAFRCTDAVAPHQTLDTAAADRESLGP